MNAREMARKLGGEEALAEYDKASNLEDKYTKFIDGFADGALEVAADPREREIILAALTEALSASYARIAVMFADNQKIARGELTVMAVRSVVGNINEATDNLEAEKAGIGDKIKSLFKPEEGK